MRFTFIYTKKLIQRDCINIIYVYRVTQIYTCTRIICNACVCTLEYTFGTREPLLRETRAANANNSEGHRRTLTRVRACGAWKFASESIGSRGHRYLGARSPTRIASAAWSMTQSPEDVLTDRNVRPNKERERKRLPKRNTSGRLRATRWMTDLGSLYSVRF